MNDWSYLNINSDGKEYALALFPPQQEQTLKKGDTFTLSCSLRNQGEKKVDSLVIRWFKDKKLMEPSSFEFVLEFFGFV